MPWEGMTDLDDMLGLGAYGEMDTFLACIMSKMTDEPVELPGHGFVQIC